MFVHHPETDTLYCFPIVRPRPRNPLSFTIVTREWRGLNTHWFGGKTVGCCQPAMCEACEVNVKKTWQGHLLGVRHEDDQLILVIFTGPVVAFLKGISRPKAQLVGAAVRLTRMGGRNTGPICRSTRCQGRGRAEREATVSISPSLT